MIDDARERFLREITAQVPADRIAELHLFRPLRRGATETGIAVIAVQQEEPAQIPAPQAPGIAAADSPYRDEGDIEGDEPRPVDTARADDDAAAEADAEADARSDLTLDVDPQGGELPGRSGDSEVALAASPVAHADVSAHESAGTDDVERELADISSINADAAPAETVESAVDSDEPPGSADVPIASTAAPAGQADVSLARPTPARPVRHTVFTARYRLTRKGAERGKWEFEVVADADAPLVTVDAVVRGVQRRAGEDEEPERLTAEGVRAALDGQAWQRTT